MTKASKISRKKSEAAAPDLTFIEELKKQWMAMLDAMIDPVIFVRNDGVIDKANKAMARWAKQDIKEIIGKPCHQVLATIGIPYPEELLGPVELEKPTKRTKTFQTPTRQFFEVSAHPHQDEQGDKLGHVLVYRDQTEAHQLQEQLIQSEKLASIGLLAGGIAHEINNPLGGILVFSQMILREMPKDSVHYPDVEEILNATERCKDIVENLLDFARTNSANATEKTTEPVPIDEAVTTALRFMKLGMFTANNIDIRLELDSDGVMVIGDRNKLIQVLLNLMQNAYQAMPDGGQLTIATDVEGHGPAARLRCHIKDTGIGIPKDQMKRIFDPFFTTKDPGEGTGLGLAICYGIIQDLQGTIQVTSDVNIGSCFTIDLPVAQQQRQSA